MLEKLHQSLGKTILQTWQFADQYIDVVSQHDNWSRDHGDTDLTDIVIVANLLNHLTSQDKPRVPLQEVPALGKLELDPASSIEVMKSANADIQAIYKLFA